MTVVTFKCKDCGCGCSGEELTMFKCGCGAPRFVASGIWWAPFTEICQSDEGEPVLAIMHGWTAGLNDEQMKNVADDAPRGHETYYLPLRYAQELRDALDSFLQQSAVTA